jgi:hypothetical protein
MPLYDAFPQCLVNYQLSICVRISRWREGARSGVITVAKRGRGDAEQSYLA